VALLPPLRVRIDPGYEPIYRELSIYLSIVISSCSMVFDCTQPSGIGV